MITVLRLAAAGAAVLALTTGGFAAAEDECRSEFGDGERVDAGPVTLYTDNAETYLGVCGFGRNGYVQVNELRRAVAGELPLAEGRTGVKEVDQAVSNGPIKVWVVQQAGAGSCAPEGDTTLGGGQLTKGLPTVYTDNGEDHVGVCDSDGDYVEAGDVPGALAGEPLVEYGNRGGSEAGA